MACQPMPGLLSVQTAGVLNLNNGAIGAILNGITKNGGTEIDGVDGADSWGVFKADVAIA